MPGSTLTLPVPRDFDLSRAVCSYGFFMLAPNRWDAETATWHTVVRGEEDRLAPVTVRAPATRRNTKTPRGKQHRLTVRSDERLSRSEAAAVKQQVARMLRLDEDFTAFHKLHPAAKRAKFGRLLRSATLFEDIVKTITGCNVAWPNTVRMNALLCEHIGGGGFPTPAQLATVTPAKLKRACKVGYRAERIIRLARDVLEGRLDLAWFEQPEHATDDLAAALRNIHGVGPYAANNLCQLLGRYDRLAIDSETYRHFRERHDMPTPQTSAELRRLHDRIESHYARYSPYQFLAYWFELWTGYEDRLGEATAWREDERVTRG